jgi:5-aminolevulinate synthase
MLTAAALPMMTSPTHIVPGFVGDPEGCKESERSFAHRARRLHPADQLPDGAGGKERLRITPSPYHHDGLD